MRAGINAADSSYGVAKYISKVNDIKNLVNVIRLRHGNKIYMPKKCKKGGGRTKGEKQAKRKQYEVVKKWQSEVEKSKIICQKE